MGSLNVRSVLPTAEQAGETNVCGDGTVDEGEGCDDGNTVTEA